MDRRTHRRGFLLGSVAALATTRLTTQAAPRLFQAATPQGQGADWQAVAQALGAKGQKMPGDVFRVGMPRTDLQVTVQNVPVKAGFALGSYAAFKQTGNETVVMGDLVLLDQEVNPVMTGLFENGLAVTALHNHLLDVAPHVMYLHVAGSGDAVQLATAIRKALSASKTPLGEEGAAGGSPGGSPAVGTPAPDLDTAQLEQILGRNGKLNNGIFSVSVPRAETITMTMPVTDAQMNEGMGARMEVPPAMGVATVINFQPTDGGQAAITGDFVLIGTEVNPVAQALRGHGIEVEALHNHGLDDEPRLFYMHFWANGDPTSLAKGLRTAVDQTNSKSS